MNDRQKILAEYLAQLFQDGEVRESDGFQAMLRKVVNCVQRDFTAVFGTLARNSFDNIIGIATNIMHMVGDRPRQPNGNPVGKAFMDLAEKMGK